MIKDTVKRNNVRIKRAFRVRKKLQGNAAKPRMSVVKSNKHIFVQLIDDESSCTLVSYGSASKELKSSELARKSKEAARHIGTKIAEKAKEAGIEKVIFDRGRFKFHGIIAELANAARSAGLQF
jgi:large subunit ribosomal protein L18